LKLLSVSHSSVVESPQHRDSSPQSAIAGPEPDERRRLHHKPRFPDEMVHAARLWLLVLKSQASCRTGVMKIQGDFMITEAAPNRGADWCRGARLPWVAQAVMM
jgi:hypothetical protein